MMESKLSAASWTRGKGEWVMESEPSAGWSQCEISTPAVKEAVSRMHAKILVIALFSS